MEPIKALFVLRSDLYGSAARFRDGNGSLLRHFFANPLELPLTRIPSVL